MNECEDCGDSYAPNSVLPADKIDPINVCDSCFHFYVDEEEVEP